MRRLSFDSPYHVRALVVLILLIGADVGSAAVDLRPYEARVVSPGASVYSGPGENFYATDTLAEGDAVEVYRKAPGGWLGIRPPEGSFSWIFSRHLKVLQNGLAEIDKEDVPSRIGSRLSDFKSAVQVKLKQRERVEIRGEQEVDGQLWYKVSPPSGEFRWIQARHLSPTGSVPHREPAPAPILTVPSATDDVVAETASITLVADNQPAPAPSGESSWRAAPNGGADETANEQASPDVVAPPLSEADPSSIPPTATSTADTQANSNIPSTANLPDASTPTIDGLDRRLADVEMRLSRIVAEPPATWQIEPLSREVEQLLTQAQTVAERTAVQSTLAKIDRFSAIGRRYRQIVPSVPGQPPITPLGGAETGVMAADGQRYDAVGVLRPVVSKRPGAPQFALLNERGQVVSFVTPTPDVNLQPYVGRQIGVTGSRGYIPEFQRAHVTAGRVAPLNERMLR